MSTIRDTDSAEVVLERLQTTSIRLSSNADLEDLTEACDATIETIEAKAKAHRKAVGRRMAATLVIARRDRALNKVFMFLSRAVVAATNGDREAPVFKAIFHKAPSAIIRPNGGPEQARDVELVLEALGSHPLAEPYRGHIEPIRAGLAQLTAAENERSALYLAEAGAGIALRAALDEGIRFHSGLHTPLMLRFKDDEDEVNSYIG
jgi:hypothetical protein